MSELPLPVEQLQQDLADSAARSDIECLCRWAWPDGVYGHRYYDTELPLKGALLTPAERREAVGRAVIYLRHRGLLQPHSLHAELVRFTDQLTAAEMMQQVAGARS